MHIMDDDECTYVVIWIIFSMTSDSMVTDSLGKLNVYHKVLLFSLFLQDITFCIFYNSIYDYVYMCGVAVIIFC